MRRRFATTALLCSLVLFVGLLNVHCGSSSTVGQVKDDDAGKVASIDTLLSKTTAKAGESVGVTCTVKDKNGNTLDVTTEVVVTPADSVAVQGKTLTASKAGSYAVACKVSATGFADATPETLTVTAGDALKVVAELDKSTVKAGETANVTCRVEDSNGNTIEATTSVKPVADLTVTGKAVSSTKAGSYQIDCQVEGQDGVQSVPATLTVNAAEPTKVVLSASPDKQRYAVDDQVTISYKVTDEYGNEVLGINGTLTAPSSGVTDNGGQKYTFQKEGRYTWSVVLDAPYQAITAELELLCDDTAPIVTIKYPDRGDTLSGDTKVTVTGTVSDSGSGVDTVMVDDKTIAVESDGSFSFEYTAKPGLNFIGVTATDKAGLSKRATVGFYYSTAFKKYASTEANTTKMTDKFVVRLSQAVLDDFDNCIPGVVGAGCPERNDLADIGEVILNNLDIAKALGGLPLYKTSLLNTTQNYPLSLQGIFSANFQLYAKANLEVTVTKIDLNGVRLSLKARDGGIDAGVSVEQVKTTPGITVHVETKLTFEAGGRLTSLNVLDSTLNTAYVIACAWTGWSAVCPSNGVYKDIAKTTGTNAGITSSFTVKSLSLEAGFDIKMANICATNPNSTLCKVVVTFKSGNVQFGDNSNFNVNLVQDMKLDLGGINVLDLFTIDLPDVWLSDFVGSVTTAIAGAINPLINGILNGLGPILDDAINLLLASGLANDGLSQVLTDAFNQFELDLPLPLPKLTSGQPVAPVVGFKTKISSIDFTAYTNNDLKSGGMVLGLGTLFHSELKTVHNKKRRYVLENGVEKEQKVDVLGSILRNGCDGSDPAPLVFTDASHPHKEFALALHLDAINQLLFALWWNKGIDLPITSADLGAGASGLGDGLDVKLTFYAPPIINNCGGKNQMEIQIADLYVEATINLGAPLTLTGFVNFSAPVNLTVNVNGELGIEIVQTGTGDNSAVFLQLELLDFNGSVPNDSALEGVFATLLKDQLIGALAGVLGGIPIPEIDLSALSDQIPAGNTISLVPEDIFNVTNTGYYVIRGSLDTGSN